MVMATATTTIVPTTATPTISLTATHVSRPVTIRVWDDYSCEYVFRTVYRDYQVCN